jgi:rhodanese-related sulfurtransferase
MDLDRLREHFEIKISAEKQLADVVEAVRNGDSTLVLLDVRGREDYQSGHIKGAWSMPLAEIDARYNELPRDREVVTYCYNQHCHLSTLGALKLVKHGIAAKEMNVGWNEWIRAGLPSHFETDDSANCKGNCAL